MARPLCLSCRKAQVMCYCKSIESFASRPQFVILIHPKESRKAINTGRMAYLHLRNALLLVGSDFSNHSALNKLLMDPHKRCYLLFPGQQALDLGSLKSEILMKAEQESIFIILDATWAMAKKMYRLSENLHQIPQIMFVPDHPSQFFIRQQPHVRCYSTIETIHYIIDFLGTHPAGEHHRLLHVFQDMVQKQIEYEHSGNS